MVPRTARNVRYGWPLGKAARATRAVSSGTGVMMCGWSDMPDVLLLRECRHDRHRGPYYAIARLPGAPLGGKEASADILYYRNTFCIKLAKNRPRGRRLSGHHLLSFE